MLMQAVSPWGWSGSRSAAPGAVALGVAPPRPSAAPMCQPWWDHAAFGKAFGGRTGALQPSHAGAGRFPLWLSSSLAPLLLPVAWIRPSPGTAAADPRSQTWGHRDQPRGSHPINISVRKKPVSFHLSQARSCVAGLPCIAGAPDPAGSSRHPSPCLCSGTVDALHGSCPAGVLGGVPGTPGSEQRTGPFLQSTKAQVGIAETRRKLAVKCMNSKKY